MGINFLPTFIYNIERACVKSRFTRSGAPIALADGFLHDSVKQTRATTLGTSKIGRESFC